MFSTYNGTMMGAGLSIDIDKKPPLATTLGVTLSSNPTPNTKCFIYITCHMITTTCPI